MARLCWRIYATAELAEYNSHMLSIGLAAPYNMGHNKPHESKAAAKNS
jgi:hypothetical protein